MKFTKETLVERVKTSRQRRIDEAQRQNDANAAKEEDARAKHLQGRNLRPLINLLRRAEDNGKALEREDFVGVLAQDRYGPPVVPWYQPRYVTQNVPDVSRHDTLLEFLAAVEDDEITSTALVQHGFKDFPRLIS